MDCLCRHCIHISDLNIHSEYSASMQISTVMRRVNRSSSESHSTEADDDDVMCDSNVARGQLQVKFAIGLSIN